MRERIEKQEKFWKLYRRKSFNNRLSGFFFVPSSSQKKLLVLRCVFSGSSNCLLLSDVPFVLSRFFTKRISRAWKTRSFLLRILSGSLEPYVRKVVFAATTLRDVDNERDAGTRKYLLHYAAGIREGNLSVCSRQTDKKHIWKIQK